MNILIIGETANFEECRQKFGKSHTYTISKMHSEAVNLFEKTDVVFDFTIDEDPSQIEVYCRYPSLIIFLNTAKISLAQLSAMASQSITPCLFGFAGLPTFLNHEILETSLWKPEHKPTLENICTRLNTSFQLVDDHVGLVTPRVICMIINEAYYTVEESTASREDVDMAMKLGTNYPFGPFEWCQQIGIRHVYEVLKAVFEDTKDERYKVCPLLEKEYLQTIRPSQT